MVWFAGGLTFVLLLTPLLFHKELLTHYHLRRLAAEPAYLRTIASSQPRTPADRALDRYLGDDKGREELAQQVIAWMLECLRNPRRTTAVLELLEWNVITLDLGQVEPESTLDDWWVTYSTTRVEISAAHVGSQGSARAPAPLVDLHRRLLALESIPERFRSDASPEFSIVLKRLAEDRIVIRLFNTKQLEE